MHANTLFATVALFAVAVAVPAKAEDAQRYTIEKTDKGYVRMDTQTGEVSVCEESGTQLVCRVAADERKALQEEIDRLYGKVVSIEERLATLEKSTILNPGGLLPSDEELDRSLDTMEKLMRRFMTIMKDSGKDATRI
ncbi:MAG: hypothetical protein AB7S80_15015 [Rhizobiaceae bacterium]